MKLLIIGGTRFMGYFTTAHALAKGHTVTLFNRGRSAPDVFPEAEHLTGDRRDPQALEVLRGRTFDAVFDTCGYIPRELRLTSEMLAGNIGQYVFVSTISVYADPPQKGYDENAALQALADPTTEEVTGETYGGLKVLCEQVVQDAFKGHALIIRPGLIVGPRDPTFRFDYWVRRIAQGGEVLAPGDPGAPVQFIDARDLGEWSVRLMEAETNGVFNATGPAEPHTMRDVLDTIATTVAVESGTASASGNAAPRFTWVPEQFLIGNQVQPWSHLPLWVPEKDSGIQRANVSRAEAAGLTFRPLEQTVRGALNDLKHHPEKVPGYQGTLTPSMEQEVLHAWHNRG